MRRLPLGHGLQRSQAPDLQPRNVRRVRRRVDLLGDDPLLLERQVRRVPRRFELPDDRAALQRRGVLAVNRRSSHR